MLNRILIVRLGAMGDVIHALPAVATLKGAFPSAKLTWALDPKWAPLIADNPYVDECLPFDRRSWASVRRAWDVLRHRRYDLAVDFQGLIKSAIITRASGARTRIGFHRAQAREPVAAWLYTKQVKTMAAHFADRCLELAQSTGAAHISREFTIPAGRPEGQLPSRDFVLACPLAGWVSKQWPREYYEELGRMLNDEGATLVVNGPPAARAELERIRGAHVHVSGIEGLIDATRRACAVVGVDSGPLHLAAALSKPGVAIFGPTDPARNGPYCATITVLRDPGAVTSYKRDRRIAETMRAIEPEMVLSALRIRREFHSAGWAK